ncbi:MAG: class I SAM-dependent methyltransferase [Spirochaetaceae bacterium]|nr:class I SAM-dependent methyltransferase [Spirochaetaceae bacterium]
MSTRSCRICGAAYSIFAIRTMRFWRCSQCGFVYRAPSQHPTSEAARARYGRHTNSLENEGYRAFLEQFLQLALLPHLQAGSRVLDFGSGPEPALARLCERQGWRAWIYDPLFAPTRGWRSRQFEAIVLHEVIEHLPHPRTTISNLRPRMANGGFIAIRTRLQPSPQAAFAGWWYKEDPTHVSFLTLASLEILAHSCGLELLARPAEDIFLLAQP